MENNQEGIELETINPNVDGIFIPDVADEEANSQTEEVEDTTSENNSNIEGNTDNDTSKTSEDKIASLQKALNKERASRKKAEREIKELEAKTLEQANKAKEKSTYETLIESGIDANVAKSISEVIDSKKTDNSQLEKEIADLKFDKQITAKSKEVGFEDIEEYAEDIRDLVDKGLSIEQAYYASSYSKPEINTKSEIARNIEAKMQNNNARKEILGNINSNIGVANTSKKINITALEKSIAAAAGMTAEEYVAVRDAGSIQDYASYKSKKK